MNRPILTALLCGCLLACSSDSSGRKEIVVTITSDLKVPSEIDRLTIDVTGLVKTQHSSADLTERDLPRTLTLVHDSGPLGPILVIASGWRDEDKIIERKVRATFPVRGSATYEIHLERACKMVTCDKDETCKAGKCGEIDNFDPGKADAGSMTTDDGGEMMTRDDSGPGKKPDAGRSDTGTPDNNRAPSCKISKPTPGQSFSTEDSVELVGTCTDPERGALSGKQILWRGNGVDLDSGSPLNLGKLAAGEKTFELCATDPDDPKLMSTCANVKVIVAEPGGPPTAKIDGARQGNDETPPFVSGRAIDFTGLGTGTGIEYAWSDNLAGDFGTEATASLESPAVGHHVVTFTVTDKDDNSVSDEIDFDVVLAEGDSIVQPYDGVNSELTTGANALAVDSKSQVLAANGADLYRFKGTDIGADLASAFSSAPTTALTAIRQIFIWNDAVYLATSTGLVVCDYDDGKAIAGTTCVTYSGGSFPSNDITAVSGGSVDDKDVLVVGTNNGLYVPADLSTITTGVTLGGQSTVGQTITGIAQGLAFDSNTHTRKDVFWLVGPGAELRIYWPYDNHCSSRSNGDDAQTMRALAIDEDDVVWVTSNIGLGRYLEQKTDDTSGTGWNGYKTNSQQDGLPSNDLTALAAMHVEISGDPHDFLWIGSDEGLTRFEYAVPEFMAITLTTDDGMPSNNVLAIALLPDGGKVISTDAGLALYAGD